MRKEKQWYRAILYTLVALLFLLTILTTSSIGIISIVNFKHNNIAIEFNLSEEVKRITNDEQYDNEWISKVIYEENKVYIDRVIDANHKIVTPTESTVIINSSFIETEDYINEEYWDKRWVNKSKFIITNSIVFVDQTKKIAGPNRYGEVESVNITNSLVIFKDEIVDYKTIPIFNVNNSIITLTNNFELEKFDSNQVLEEDSIALKNKLYRGKRIKNNSYIDSKLEKE